MPPPKNPKSYRRLAAHRQVGPGDESDRRREPRLAIRLPARFSSESLEMEVDVETMASAHGPEVTHLIENISARGLFVRSDFLEPTGTAVRIDVDVDGVTLELHGAIAWVAEQPPRGPGMGIALDETSVMALDRASLVKRAREIA